MTCISCKRLLQSDKSGFIVCSNCGSVNIPNLLDKPENLIEINDPVRRTLLPKKVISLILVVTATTILTGGIVAAFTFHTNPHHKQTVTVTKADATSKASASTKSAGTQPGSVVEMPPKPGAITPSPSVTTQTSTPALQPSSPAAVSQLTLDGIVNSINQQLRPYGVTVTLTPPNHMYSYSTWSELTNADANNLQQFSAYLTQEFSKYPKDLVTNSGLKTIGLVKNLQVAGTARASVPTPIVTGMVYDANTLATAGSVYARVVVSHEYWHYLDYVTYGSYTYDDPGWGACNPTGFTYGAGGATAYGANSGYVAAFHPSATFITAYSKYGIEEDRAEMFGWLMYSPSSVKNLNDSGINCKINRLTTLVRQLSPSMGF